MRNILFFDVMLTTKIITFLYWFLLLASLVSGLWAMLAESGPGFFAGLGIIIGGALVSRLWCEFLIVLFKINDNLQSIVNKQNNR